MVWGKVRREGWGRRPHLRTPRPAHKSGSARATACGREVVFTPHCTPPAGPQLGGPGQAVVEVEAAAGLPGAQGGPVVRRGSSAWGSRTGCGGCGRAAMRQELRHGGERERPLQPPHAQTPEGLGGRPTPLAPSSAGRSAHPIPWVPPGRGLRGKPEPEAGTRDTP